MSEAFPGPLAAPAGPVLAAHALALLASATLERERLSNDIDGTALHDFRVAVRRLRSLLRVYSDEIQVPRRLLRRLRQLARETGELRDIEVQLAWLRGARANLAPAERRGNAWLVTRLEKAGKGARGKLAERLAAGFDRVEPALRERLATRTTAPLSGDETLGAAVGALVPALAARLAATLDGVRSVDHQAEAHRARIAAKRLRYALEPVAEYRPEVRALGAELVQLQDLLGAMHDAELLSGSIARAVKKVSVARGRRASKAVRRGDSTPRTRAPRDPTSGLLALASVVHAAKEGHYKVLAADWLGARNRRLLESADGLTHLLLPGLAAESNLEIERKYLLRAMPALPQSAGQRTLEMDQGYIPGLNVRERLRRVREGTAVRHYRTVKLGQGLSRQEFEDQTSAAVFDAMWPLTEGRRIVKRRHVIPDGTFHWEVDEFLDRDLVLAEVEIPTEETPVTIPDWLTPVLEREVTGETAYLNSTLAR